MTVYSPYWLIDRIAALCVGLGIGGHSPIFRKNCLEGVGAGKALLRCAPKAPPCVPLIFGPPWRRLSYLLSWDSQVCSPCLLKEAELALPLGDRILGRRERALRFDLG